MLTWKRKQKRSGVGRSAAPFRVESLENRQLMAADLVAITPANGSANVSVSANLELTYSDNVQVGSGTGNLLIKKVADGSLVEAVNLHSDRVSISGNKVTVDPVADLPALTELFVEADLAAVRDSSASASVQKIYAENFDALPLRNSSFNAPFDDFVVTISGVLDVQTAGEYTFGINSDDGQALWIDVNQDGLDLIGFEDEIIVDDSTHGRQDRLSTCIDGTTGQWLASCVDTGTGSGVELSVGQYPFQFLFFDQGGGSGGEVFYASGYHEFFNDNDFVLVGDASKGIAVSIDGLTMTAYKADDITQNIGNLSDATDLRDGNIPNHSLYPASVKVERADAQSTGGRGRFVVDNPIPKVAEWALVADPDKADFNSDGPFGWHLDDQYLYDTWGQGAAPGEYEGWSFMDKDLWIQEQGNQSRDLFTLGQNTVALIDPDAYDDFVNIDAKAGDDPAQCAALDEGDRAAGAECGEFQAAMSTPKIYLNGVAANSATLKFDSSWWDETTQAAEGRVEYFNQAGESLGSNVIYRWESMPSSPNFKDEAGPEGDARNETLTFDLQNPAQAASMVITWDMPYAQNDWWWAIDNIEVTASVTGQVSAEIRSATTWTFTTGAASVGLPGDIDGNGTVAFADFLILSANFNKDVPAGTLGDFDSNGRVEFADFLVLSSNFGKSLSPPPVATPDVAVDLVLASIDLDDEGDAFDFTLL